ncbi:MAG: tRNA pseudouridine(38-40) synthase TruA [Nitrospinae bacterium]|nr:tRNA pseudouridine(38-40) synthase TruA [Nitrospinota bacterium]
MKHPLRNVLLIVEYDGTNYCGWQSQAKGVSIQSLIEKAIGKILGKRSPALASGRTDAGVHAHAQPVNVRGHFPMDDATLLRALNSMLPPDIAIKSALTVAPDFHAIRNAKWKTYRYQIWNSTEKSALNARTAWHVVSPLNLAAMKKGAAAMVGKHDFSSFQGAHSSIKGTVRTIISLEIKRRDELMTVEVTANGFLKQMVRNIVGTLVEMGRGRMEPERMKEIISAKDRTKAGPTAPPQGLFLVNVEY